MSRLFVTVLQGDTPEKARTVIATEDSRVVAAVACAISKCLGANSNSSDRLQDLVRKSKSKYSGDSQET